MKVQNAFSFHSYLDIAWDATWFNRVPNGYWDIKENRRNFLLEFSKKVGIKIPSDWGKISVRTVLEHGGWVIISKHGGSLFKTLQEVFPGTENSLLFK